MKSEKKETPVATKSTKQLAQEKADQLSIEYKVKVHPIFFILPETGEEVIGFVKEPSRAAKIAVMDKAVMGAFSAAEEIVPSVLIKEHSDPRMSSEAPEHDNIGIGVTMAVYGLIKFLTNVAGKKK